MLANFLNRLPFKKNGASAANGRAHWGVALVVLFWTVAGFGIAQVLVVGVGFALQSFGVALADTDRTVLTAVSALLVYGLTLLVLIGVPWWTKKYRTSREDMGLTRLMSWTDIGLAPVGLVVYFFVSSVLVYVFSQLVPSIDLTQTQETGFENIHLYYQYLLVFGVLVILAPVAEEMIFRGYLYGKLRKALPVWVAMLLTSIVFGLVHGQWNVAIDVFALSMVLCSLREITGNIWAGMLLHLLKNGVAFYILFINPALLHTIGG